jgi:hypothetical protein
VAARPSAQAPRPSRPAFYEYECAKRAPPAAVRADQGGRRPAPWARPANTLRRRLLPPYYRHLPAKKSARLAACTTRTDARKGPKVPAICAKNIPPRRALARRPYHPENNPQLVARQEAISSSTNGPQPKQTPCERGHFSPPASSSKSSTGRRTALRKGPRPRRRRRSWPTRPQNSARTLQNARAVERASPLRPPILNSAFVLTARAKSTFLERRFWDNLPQLRDQRRIFATAPPPRTQELCTTPAFVRGRRGGLLNAPGRRETPSPLCRSSRSARGTNRPCVR